MHQEKKPAQLVGRWPEYVANRRVPDSRGIVWNRDARRPPVAGTNSRTSHLDYCKLVLHYHQQALGDTQIVDGGMKKRKPRSPNTETLACLRAAIFGFHGY